MDYARHYTSLVERARRRVLLGYYEEHHVVPRCLGGSNARSNRVRLTPEEHFVAHQLLVKIHPGERGLVYAAWRLTHSRDGQGVSRNKAYGWLKRLHAETRSAHYTGRKQSAEARMKQSVAMKCRKQSPEHAAKQCAARTGAKRSAEARERMRMAQLGKPRSPEHVALISAGLRAMYAARGVVRRVPPKFGSQEYREAMRASVAESRTPAVRARIADGVRRAWAAKRGEAHG